MSAREQIAELVAAQAARARRSARAFEDRMLTRRLAPYGVAASRILAGIAYLGILLTNYPDHALLFGDASAWAQPYRDSGEQAAWVGFLADVPNAVFALFTLAVLACGLCFVLGWRTRIAGLLFLVGSVQILEMNPLVGNQGDNVLRIGIALVLLTECGAVWSLDARRERKRGPRSGKGLAALAAHPTWATARTVVHNAAVVALGMQLIIIYVAAALYKVPGVGWREGTAISYPVSSDMYRVWPMLNDLVVASGVVVWLATYGAIFLQLYFPAMLLNRVGRRIALVAVVGLHAGIGVLMGLPWFSLAMVAFDGIFVSTATYLNLDAWAGPRVSRRLDAVAARLPWVGREAPEAPGEPEPSPIPAGVGGPGR